MSNLLRRRKLSAVELANAFLDRLETLGPRYNAVAELTRDRALAQARQADRRLKRGETDRPLMGIPFGVKDAIAAADIPTRWGAPPFRDQVFDYDATVIERLRAGGAVLTAKLAMVQFAGVGGYRYASASLNGPGLNPWNTRHWSGGSSSGPGSAVAAGLVPFAIGGETRGSIMTPAAFCGITGLRPSSGVVSRYGALVLAWSLDKLGPMARTAEDCGIVLAAITGRDERDPATVDWSYRPTRKTTFCIGVPPVDAHAEPSTCRAFQEALGVLRKLGMKLQPLDLPPYDYWDISQAILAGETVAAHEELLRSERLDLFLDDQPTGLRAFLEQSATAYVGAAEARVAATRDVRALFGQVDAIVMPTVPTEAPTVDTDLRGRFRGTLGPLLGAVAGLPGLSVPMGFGANHLPLGLSILGDLFAEPVILRIGMLFQRETDWHLRHPLTI